MRVKNVSLCHRDGFRRDMGRYENSNMDKLYIENN